MRFLSDPPGAIATTRHVRKQFGFGEA